MTRPFRLSALVALALASTPAVASACPPAHRVGGPAAELTRFLDAVEPDLAFPPGVAWGDAWTALGRWSSTPTAALPDRERDALAEAALAEVDAAYGLELAEWATGVPMAATERVETLGLIVYEDSGGPDALRVLATGAYWSTPLGDRLRIVDTHGTLRAGSFDELRRRAARWVSTCAVEVTEWVGMSTRIAEELLAASDRTWLLAYGPRRTSREVPWSAWVEAPDVEAALRFQHEAVAGRETYSALFVGPGPGLARALRTMPQVRSTLGPLDLAGWLRRAVR